MLLQVDFGQEWGGLTLVGYTLIDANQVEVIPRTTDGVHAIGGGLYRADVDVPANFEGSIYWDTSPGSEIYASETVKGPVVLAEPTTVPQFGVATTEEWIAYLAAWSVNKVEADDVTGQVRLRKNDDSGNIAVHPFVDEGGVFTNDKAQ